MGSATIYGAITARDVTTFGTVNIHYDLALARIKVMVAPFRIVNQSRDVF